MNYIDYLNDFNRWLESNTLSASSQLMYYKLLHVFNRAGWCDSVQVDNRRLMVLAEIKSEKTLIRARDELVEAGLLIYRKGKKGYPNKYYLQKIPCNNYSENDSDYDSKNDSISDSKSDSENDSHIKTKNKTKTKKEENSPTESKRNAFIPPTLEEIEAYCRERQNSVDPKRFFDYFNASNWVDSRGNKVKNWKQKIITWEGRNNDSTRERKGGELSVGTNKPDYSANTDSGKRWNISYTLDGTSES